MNEYLLGVFTRCSCAYESMKPVKQRERAGQARQSQDRNSLGSFGEAWDMSPRLTMAIQDGGHVTRRSVVFLFLHFYFLKKRFSYNPSHYNMSFFVLNSFLSLFSVMVP